jgi:hypothetical protein
MVRCDNSAGERDYFMIVSRGRVQRLDASKRGPVFWPIAETHADARRLCEWFGKPGIRPARIGSVPGETLEGHISLAIEDGCAAVGCVAGWAPDGSPTWKWLALR